MQVRLGQFWYYRQSSKYCTGCSRLILIDLYCCQKHCGGCKYNYGSNCEGCDGKCPSCATRVEKKWGKCPHRWYFKNLHIWPKWWDTRDRQTGLCSTCFEENNKTLEMEKELQLLEEAVSMFKDATNNKRRAK